MMKLKTLLFFIISLFAIGSIVGCSREHYAYIITIDDVQCTHTEQTIELKYRLHESYDSANAKFVASTNADWVTNIDASEFGVLRISVEQNSGAKREAKITLSAKSCKPAEIVLSQYAKPADKANHTLMFYFFGTSLSRYFETNLEDAVTAIETGILGNSNRVLFLRQESKNSGYIGELCYDITTKKCTEFRLKDITFSDNVITPEKIGEHIATMAELAPALRYGIIFAGHGQGWITREIINRDGDISPSALSVDYNPWIPAVGAEVTRAFGERNVQVNIDELAAGIDRSQIELDYILFDACFMSNIEAIYDLRNSANYIIASPCEIMGNGFPYHRTLPYLFENEGKTTDYIKAAESYHIYYRDEYISSNKCGSISVFDCHEIEALAKVTHELVKTAKTEYNTEELQTYEGHSPHHFYDFGQWGEVVATDDELRTQFVEQLKKSVIATFTLDSFYSAYGHYGTYSIDKDVYTGVTTSAPSKAYPNGWRQTNWHKDVIALEN